MEKIQAYIGLGDSMSIDSYPYYDLSETNPAAPSAVGAVSLFYRNQSSVWPEFENRDLLSANPAMRICNLTQDGATTFDFLDESYFSFLKEFEAVPSLVTVTLCGNDMLRTLAQETENIEFETTQILERYDQFVKTLMQKLPRAICLFSTIYDPTDGTGILPGFGDISVKLKWLSFVNEGIKDCATRNCAMLADVHEHFLGHGLSAPKNECWYWEPSPIEPGARGASEIRRLWYDLVAKEKLI